MSDIEIIEESPDTSLDFSTPKKTPRKRKLTYKSPVRQSPRIAARQKTPRKAKAKVHAVSTDDEDDYDAWREKTPPLGPRRNPEKDAKRYSWEMEDPKDPDYTPLPHIPRPRSRMRAIKKSAKKTPVKRQESLHERLGEETTDAIIEWLKQNTYVYDRLAAKYKDFTRTKRKMTERSIEMDLPPTTISNFYNTYRNKFAKMLKAKPSGSGADAVDFGPDQWIWDKFQFLQDSSQGCD